MANMWAFEPSEVRRALRSSAEAFSAAVAAVPAELWDAPGLGEWTVRELVGHAGRALTTITHYLGEPVPERAEVLAGPTQYFTRLAPLIDHSLIAERGRAAAAKLGDDPAKAVAELVASTLAAVEGADDDQLVVTPAGAMLLVEYLPSRVFELTVHRLDIEEATGIAPGHDDAGTEVSLVFTAALISSRPEATAVLLSLTGRRLLPKNFNAF